MKRFGLPSPAMVVALGALFLSVGGNVTAAVLVTSASIQDNTIRSVDVRNAAITGTDLADSTIRGVDVRDGAMTTADVANGSLTGVDVADSSLTGTDVGDGSLTGHDVENDSLDGVDIVDKSVTSDDVKANTIGSAEITNGGVVGEDIASGAVNASKVGDHSLTGDDLARDTIGADELGAVVVRVGAAVTVPGNTAENGNYITRESLVSCVSDEQLIGGGAGWSPLEGAANDLELMIVFSRPFGNGWFARGGNDTASDANFQVYAICLDA